MVFSVVSLVAQKLLCGAIRVYKRVISPLLPTACRFYPTCSTYAYEAIVKYGPLKGTALAIKRLSRCHPFHQGGYDPVP